MPHHKRLIIFIFPLKIDLNTKTFPRTLENYSTTSNVHHKCNKSIMSTHEHPTIFVKLHLSESFYIFTITRSVKINALFKNYSHCYMISFIESYVQSSAYGSTIHGTFQDILALERSRTRFIWNGFFQRNLRWIPLSRDCRRCSEFNDM